MAQGGNSLLPYPRIGRRYDYGNYYDPNEYPLYRHQRAAEIKKRAMIPQLRLGKRISRAAPNALLDHYGQQSERRSFIPYPRVG
ncbi:unnamed protein product [Gordionus sp. m RMFG-2023]